MSTLGSTTDVKKPVLKIVVPKPPTVAEVKPKEVKQEKVESEDEEIMSDQSEEESFSEDSGGDGEKFYVEISLTCEHNETGEAEDNHVLFCFSSEQDYLDHGESGYEDLQQHFEDAVTEHFPDYTYKGEMEEYCVYGPDLPDEDLPIVEVE